MPVYSLAARCTTEIIGTAAGVYVGEASIANALLPSAKGQGMGFGWIAFAYALAFFFPALFFGHISAILNPAFCMGMLVNGDLTFRDFLALSFSEILGGFIGGVLVWIHWIPHLKTVPEAPPACAEDHLIRKRDSITKCGVQIASYNTQADRSTRRAVGGLVGCFKDIVYYLSHHHLPDTLPFAHRRSRGDSTPERGQGAGQGLSQEELHKQLCKEEGVKGAAAAAAAAEQKAAVLGAGFVAKEGAAKQCEPGSALQQAELPQGEIASRQQHNIHAIAEGSAASGGLIGAEAEAAGQLQGLSPPDTPREYRTPPYEQQSNPSSTCSLQALLPGGAEARWQAQEAASTAAAGSSADVPAAGNNAKASLAASAAVDGKAASSPSVQDSNKALATSAPLLTKEELQQRRRAQKAYQAALIADQNVKLSIFATRPAIYAPFFNFVVEFMSTILLVAGIMLIQRHCDTIQFSDPVVYSVYTQGLSPFFVGLWVVVLVLGVGGPTGLAVNPARDLGPRMAFAVLPIPNKGSTEWHYAWIPVVAPLIGGACGGAIADALQHLR